MKKIRITILLIGLLSQLSFAQEFEKTRLDNYFEALEINNKFMGSVAVSQNGKLIYYKTIGYSDVDNKIKANENSKYRIGSISKTFTTVLIFKGIEMRKININQTIDKYFPSIKNANKITISHLLNHRSGISNFTNEKDYLTWNTLPKTVNEMIEIIAKKGIDFEPDTKAEYSNSNFVLLTYILEKTFKKSYSDLLSLYITKPLNLKNTYLGGKINTQSNECNSYRFVDNWKIESETDVSISLGAGGIVSTPSDLIKFSDALFTGKIITNKSLDQMKIMKDNFGMGLFQFPFDNKTALGHNGSIDGFSSSFSFFTDSTTSYALISNGSNFNNNNISITVLCAIFGKPFAIPNFKTFDVSSDELDKYLGTYTSKQIPLKITITKNNKTLIAQATGQSSFPLEATEKDKFMFEQAGVKLEFNSTDNSMILKQGNGIFTFNKD